MDITIKNVRFSYCNLFQPQTRPGQAVAKFGVTNLVPKDNAAAKAIIDQAVAQAIEKGISTCWNGVRPPKIEICVHDGDGPRPSDGQPFGEECKGCWVFTATSKDKPIVVDAQVQDIIDPTQVYSGTWGNVSVSFYPYNNNGRKGIGCGLNGVQKVRDGDPLGHRVTAQEAFQPVAQTPAPAPNYSQPYAAPAVDPITGQPVAQTYAPTGFPVAGI